MSYPGHSLGGLPLCRGAVSVFYSPSRLGKLEIELFNYLAVWTNDWNLIELLLIHNSTWNSLALCLSKIILYYIKILVTTSLSANKWLILNRIIAIIETIKLCRNNCNTLLQKKVVMIHSKTKYRKTIYFQIMYSYPFNCMKKKKDRC